VGVELVERLQASRTAVLGNAAKALARADLPHYLALGEEESFHRLDHLLELVIDCLQRRTLAPIIGYGARVADERFQAGFDIGEVQIAFNVLEEAIWQVIVPELPAEELPTATGMIGTVLGAGKDSLACTWVSLASSRHVPSLNLNALFQGSEG
jgi:hypothetical protein